MENLELLMVLAGENAKTRPRTNHVIKIHNEIGTVHGARIPLYLTGSHSGLNGIYLLEGEKPICEQARDYALQKGVKDEYLILEEKRQGVCSLDTIANFAFANEIIPKKFHDIGLFTEVGHMQRGLWCATKVFSDMADFIPFSSEPDIIRGIVKQMHEGVTFQALKLDFLNIKDGDTKAIQNYMETIHPFHALTYGNNPKFSFYGLTAFMGKILNARKKNIYSQRQI
ncbi:MAG: YdcF family protein [Candidatus Pacearchaeota archaeon]